MAQQAFQVKGLRDMNRALARADKTVRADARKIMREVAVPVASAAEANAVTHIRNIGERWPQMRIGVTQKAIYVVPKAKRRRGSPRPNLARLLAQRAMRPAEAKYAPTYEREFERAMDKMAKQFNRG